jgi:hypothetical protein
VTRPSFPATFYAGVAHFNAGRYFEAHEAFEEGLDAVEADARWDLLVALVQVAVGYHKLASGHPGAGRMLGLGAEKLAAFAPKQWGVGIAALRTRAAKDAAALEAGQAAPARRLTSAPPVLVVQGVPVTRSGGRGGSS